MHEFPPGLLPFDAPFTLGHENAGWVERSAPGSGDRAGPTRRGLRRVGLRALPPVPAGRENYCENRATYPKEGSGLGFDGGMAPLLLVPSVRDLVPCATSIPWPPLPLTDAGLTPYHAIGGRSGSWSPGRTRW